MLHQLCTKTSQMSSRVAELVAMLVSRSVNEMSCTKVHNKSANVADLLRICRATDLQRIAQVEAGLYASQHGV